MAFGLFLIRGTEEERVIRFNSMPNLLLDEPVGHLYANACSRGWWGVSGCNRAHQCPPKNSFCPIQVQEPDEHMNMNY
eukprot:4153323-Amphidinium_carterae.1